MLLSILSQEEDTDHSIQMKGLNSPLSYFPHNLSGSSFSSEKVADLQKWRASVQCVLFVFFQTCKYDSLESSSTLFSEKAHGISASPKWYFAILCEIVGWLHTILKFTHLLQLHICISVSLQSHCQFHNIFSLFPIEWQKILHICCTYVLHTKCTRQWLGFLWGLLQNISLSKRQQIHFRCTQTFSAGVFCWENIFQRPGCKYNLFPGCTSSWALLAGRNIFSSTIYFSSFSTQDPFKQIHLLWIKRNVYFEVSCQSSILPAHWGCNFWWFKALWSVWWSSGALWNSVTCNIRRRQICGRLPNLSSCYCNWNVS